MTWANGGGTTSEIHAEPSPDGGWWWRVSAADVSRDGPFSTLPGIDRKLLIVRGRGVRLSIHRAPDVLLDRTSAVMAFAGERPVESRLVDGAVLDLNLMVRRDRGVGALRRTPLSSGAEWTPSPDDRLVVVLSGSVTLEGERLGELDAVLCSMQPPQPPLLAEADSSLAVVTVVPL